MRLIDIIRGHQSDSMIDTLIVPPVLKFEGFDYSKADKLRPTGDAQKELSVSVRYGGTFRERSE